MTRSVQRSEPVNAASSAEGEIGDASATPAADLGPEIVDPAAPAGPPATPPPRRRRHLRRYLLFGVAGLVIAGLCVLAISRLNLHSVGHTLTTATPGWIVLALVVMGSSLVLRAVSWRETLKAAMPDLHFGWLAVTRAAMIGVMASALVPGRAGEPARALIVSRRLGSARRYFTLVMGTVFSQTIVNLFALLVLAVITFTRVSIFHGREGALVAVVVLPLAVALLVVGAPRLLARLARSGSSRVRRVAEPLARQLGLARQGLRVFARPRNAAPAVVAQLGAWALQWLACYCVLLALHFTPRANLATAAAILLAVNLSAVLPATPSNVGVFQAACLVVLAAFGFGAGKAVAYGIALQAVEVVTAVALGLPALLGEGMSWREFGRLAEAEDTPAAQAETEATT